MEHSRHRMSSLWKNQWFFLLIVILGISLITAILNPRFLRINNIINILQQVSTLGVVAAGATILIISGNFDISAGANLGLSACIMAMMIKSGVPSVLAVLTGLFVSMFCSFLVGAASIMFKAPSFIISLAAAGIFKGISLALTAAVLQNIYGQFEFLGATRFFGIVPLLFLVSLIVYFFVFILLKYTLLGRRIYSIGSNPTAAYLSGINIKLNKLIFFMISGGLIGLAATMMLSRIGAAQASTGSGIELTAIGAVVIGGTTMDGGKGGIVGTFFGVLLMGVIANSLNMLQVSPYLQGVINGVVIVIAIAVSSLSQSDQKRVV
ncbi:ABC transporter permease [Oceanispirochaeta sp.]|jgi:ribose transport system permease protein|uniref:ABC transporter permease n=1 Tax=Oceanispirochaeta sp. TaxID=2035350 RepID=UPI0026038431|nr:ABC transporter permease [Oceanispirochaeta sp.]MDA3958291.1 ABC transporter permease [Oceanispirochaeta sp.]